MGAREKIFSHVERLVGDEMAWKVADEILAEHARELAAAIRAEYEGHPRPGELDPYWAADLIDPDEEA